MADDIRELIKQSKENVREMLKKVPNSVLSGGIKQARAYKDLVFQANKLLANKSPQYAALKQVENQLRALQ